MTADQFRSRLRPGDLLRTATSGLRVRKLRAVPRLLRLGVPVGTYGAPDVDMRRHRRVGVRVALQVDMIPSQRPRLLGPDADQEAQDNVGTQGPA